MSKLKLKRHIREMKIFGDMWFCFLKVIVAIIATLIIVILMLNDIQYGN